MKIFLLLLLAAAPASAGWGRAENSAAAALASARAEISVIGGVPLLDLLAERDKAALPLTIGGQEFLATVVFDSEWNNWVTLKPAGGGFGAGAWTEAALGTGVVYKYKDLVLKVKKTEDLVSVESAAGEKVEFTVNGTIPGPTLVANEGDVIEMTVANDGEVEHGVSIHAAYTQTSKYFGKIAPGETRSLLFRVNHPGVYMYHCAPGGHAIPMHTLLGQYGMMVVKPKTVKFKAEEIIGHPPDVELYLVQHELYTSGKDAVEGHAAYVMFNGKLFR
ncbi:MAG: multicopper oxidase domain-containing protein, partial [Planctomycetota bacterium]